MTSAEHRKIATKTSPAGQTQEAWMLLEVLAATPATARTRLGHSNGVSGAEAHMNVIIHIKLPEDTGSYITMSMCFPLLPLVALPLLPFIAVDVMPLYAGRRRRPSGGSSARAMADMGWTCALFLPGVKRSFTVIGMCSLPLLIMDACVILLVTAMLVMTRAQPPATTSVCGGSGRAWSWAAELLCNAAAATTAAAAPPWEVRNATPLALTSVCPRGPRAWTPGRLYSAVHSALTSASLLACRA
jgi:hypothetical protein